MISTKRLHITFGIFLFVTFYACLLAFLRPALIGRFRADFLIWNLFLAWIPFFLSCVIHYIYRKHFDRRILVYCVCIPCALLWLLFYPNAPYMLTNFSHFSHFTFFAGRNEPILLAAWYDFIMYSVFVLTSFLMGCVSLYTLQSIVKNITNTVWSWLFVFGVLLLSSYAIFLGRFLRLNSWDVWHNAPNLIAQIQQSLTLRNFIFTVLFCIFLLMIYLAFVSIVHLKQSSK